MKVRNILLTITAAALIAVPLAAVAQGVPGGGNGGGPGGGWGHGPRGGGHGPDQGLGMLERLLPRVADELGLTDAQLEEIQAILDQARPEIESAREKLQSLRQTRRDDHDPAVFNEGEVRAFAADLAEVQVELMVVVERTRAAALQVLSEEQRQQLEEMRGTFGKRFTRRSGGRRS